MLAISGIVTFVRGTRPSVIIGWQGFKNIWRFYIGGGLQLGLQLVPEIVKACSAAVQIHPEVHQSHGWAVGSTCWKVPQSSWESIWIHPHSGNVQNIWSPLLWRFHVLQQCRTYHSVHSWIQSPSSSMLKTNIVIGKIKLEIGTHQWATSQFLVGWEKFLNIKKQQLWQAPLQMTIVSWNTNLWHAVIVIPPN